MKKTTLLIYCSLTLILLSQISNVYAQKSTNKPGNCLPGQTTGYPITFDPVGYKGNYYIDTNAPSGRCDGFNTPKLTVGNHFLIIGYDGEENKIYFNVGEGGKITLADNLKAACFKNDDGELNKGVFKFKNTTVTIDPQKYEGVYYPSPYNNLPLLAKRYKKQSFELVPNLQYYVEIYASGYGDEIVFHVGASGDISEVTNQRAAFVKKETPTTLTFHNVLIKITSPDYNGKAMLNGDEISVSSESINWYRIVPSTFAVLYLPGNSVGERFIVTSYFNVPRQIVFRAEGKSEKILRFDVCTFVED